MNLVAFRAFCRRNVRELPQIINHMPRIREYVERDEYKTQHRPGHFSPRPVVPGMHRKRTPEEMEELRQEAERERAERYRDLYERLGLKVIAFKDKTLEVTGQSGIDKITLGPDKPPPKDPKIVSPPPDDPCWDEEDSRPNRLSPRPTPITTTALRFRVDLDTKGEMEMSLRA